MKRFALILCAVLGMVVGHGRAHAWCCGGLNYGGQQPCWNCCNKKNKCLSPEEQRLQRFWHDYYDALQKYYGLLDHMDWVAYYKNHGYQINGGGCGANGGCCSINYAPVFVSPSIQWAVPTGGGCAPGGPYGAMGHP
jgi:hypothetical protein